MSETASRELSLAVGILEREQIALSLEGSYSAQGGARSFSGPTVARVDADGVVLGTEAGVVVHAKEITLVPGDPQKNVFLVYDVVIGKDFHWERTEHQRFRGSLRLLRAGRNVLAINVVGTEEYLKSVISSEMSAEGPLEFLKAHAIASRSWLLAQMERSRALKGGTASRPPSVIQEPGRVIRWYDREDHALFDVCADDHCQRYQGITKAYTPAVAQAVEATRGLAVLADGRICDARFSKSCGGISELYENTWDPEHHTYLVPVRDASEESIPDLTQENVAASWIRSAPEGYCRLDDPAIVRRILPQVDRETAETFRWKAVLHQEELAARVREKTGIDVGNILSLTAVRRGPSGRMIELLITGTKTALTVGKELEIRRVLSASHLRSSAFVADPEEYAGVVPGKFVLTGAGWGHGVGLCQIGAGVMGDRGFTAEQILKHYFSGATIERLYQ